MLTVACVKQGARYGADYVNILHAAVMRHLTLPHQFVCLTDDAKEIDPDVRTIALPDGLTGWWAKMALFAPGMFKADQRILFLDLDTLIVGAIEQIAAYDGVFCILRDFYRPDGWQSAVMAWTPSAHTERLWNLWDHAGRPEIQGGDQAWIEHNLSFKPELWQDQFPGQFVSYKADCFYAPPPKAARVVCFHGLPRPHEVNREWVKQAWSISRP